MTEFAAEVKQKERFEFGKNWSNFLKLLSEERILQAERSLKNMLSVENLAGKSFLDIGSGSGLFSLAARRLGASVYSFDYDPSSVACTRELKKRYYAEDNDWIIVEGNVLSEQYVASLGTYDVVYSWGVLHHTGDMWSALSNVSSLVNPGGKLFIAIYNDQGGTSRRWTKIKKLYNKSPKISKLFMVLLIGCMFELRSAVGRTLSLQNPLPFKDWANRKKNRGMSVWYDLVDWVGGYPFEVAKPEEIFEFYTNRNFVLKKMITCAGGLGCNEFVFQKIDKP